MYYVIRPDADFRGYGGKVASGVVSRGDEVKALPSGKSSRIKRIVTYDGDLEKAFAPQSVTIVLEDEIDLSRGEMLVKAGDEPNVGHNFKAMMVWMDVEAMDRGKSFFLKQTTNTTRAHVRRVEYKVNVNTMERSAAEALSLNEIGLVDISTTSPLIYDAYSDNRATGAFILIDPISNFTSAVGMIVGPDETAESRHDLPRTLTVNLSLLGIGAEHYDAVERACRFLREQGVDVVCTDK